MECVERKPGEAPLFGDQICIELELVFENQLVEIRELTQAGNLSHKSPEIILDLEQEHNRASMVEMDSPALRGN